MSNAGNQAATPRPSVFISYASDDRNAARALRDVLAAAGLVVWYDESELGGGDAWDQKIRRQIRDCDYFLPVISAATERRKEGYFRREWRLATERTMDMADDVLFLLPVVIDGTTEQGARVPDRFLSVQWIRAPGGVTTPALEALIARLVAGEHTITTRPPTLTRAPFQANPSSGKEDPSSSHPAPPPMPPFPHVPEKGGFFHGVKFIAEVLWWALGAAWLLFNRLPRWARIVVTVWLVTTLFSIKCSQTRDDPSPVPARPAAGRNAENSKKNRAAAEAIAAAAREIGIDVDPAEIARLRAEIAQAFGEGFREGVTVGKPLMIVPFAPPNATAAPEKFAHAVFLSLYGRLSLERRNEVAVTAPVRGESAHAALLARAKHFGSTYVLLASFSPAGAESTLTVRLLTVTDGNTAWSESFPLAAAEPTDVAEKIAGHLLPLLPKKEPRRANKPDK